MQQCKETYGLCRLDRQFSLDNQPKVIVAKTNEVKGHFVDVSLEFQACSF